MQMTHPLEISHPGIISLQDEQDDTQLVKASQQGDQDAFALLVQRHQRRIFNMVFRMLQDYETASEITQEAFLAAWQGLPSFRNEARFATWLYRIAYNCALKQLERHMRERSMQAAMEAEQIEKLPAKYRIVLILRHLHDKTYEEMADILAMPIGTIKTHLFRARSLLKERLCNAQQKGKAL